MRILKILLVISLAVNGILLHIEAKKLDKLQINYVELKLFERTKERPHEIVDGDHPNTYISETDYAEYTKHENRAFRHFLALLILAFLLLYFQVKEHINERKKII
jgi:hypothetical protein